MTMSLSALRGQGLVDDDENITKGGMEVLTTLVKLLPPIHQGKYGDLFVPFMSKVVPTCVELVIIRPSDGAVLLTYRDDVYFKGWHTPGTYVGPRETRQETVTRCASRELKVPVQYVRDLSPVFDHPDSVRFHDASTLVFCRVDEEPKAGKWFTECPPDLIEVHRPFWPVIEEAMHQRGRCITDYGLE